MRAANRCRQDAETTWKTAACRRGAWVASQAMKSVTSFLNRLLAMAMEDQEIIFKCARHTSQNMMPKSHLDALPVAVVCSLMRPAAG